MVSPAQTAPAHVAVRGLRKIFHDGGMFSRRRHVAIDDVTLSLPAAAGRVLSIVGESGSGKTSLARCILRLVEPDSGEIDVAGQPVVRGGRRVLGTDAMRRLIQPIFQNPFETFSLKRPVEEYLFRTAINLVDEERGGSPGEAVEDALRAVGLEYRRVAGKGVRAFSGGELQRISVARALIARPRLIVADEPVSMVDASLRMTIVNLFRRLAEERGIAFVYITHDLSTAYYLSDMMAIMKSGSIVECGRPDQILASPKAAYTRLLMDSIPTLDHRWIN